MKRGTNRVAVFSAKRRILPGCVTGWLAVAAVCGLLCGTGECGESTGKAPMRERHDSPQPFPLESRSLAERWKAQSHVAKLRANVVVSLAENDVEEALSAQRELVSALERFAGPGHWRTKNGTAFLAELEQVSKLTPKELVCYHDAYQEMNKAVKRMAVVQYADARDPLDSAVRSLTRLLGEDSISLAAAIENLGIVFLMNNEFTNAKEHFARGAEIKKSLLGADHPDYARSVSLIGYACLQSEEHEQAEAFFRDALTRNRGSFGMESFEYANDLCNLSRALVGKKQFAEAGALCRQAISTVERHQERESRPLTISCLFTLARVKMAYGEYDEAETDLLRCLRIYAGRIPPDSRTIAPRKSAILDTYALLLRDTGRTAEAAAVETRARENREATRRSGKEESQQYEASAEKG